jgi:hypothetical protein
LLCWASKNVAIGRDDLRSLCLAIQHHLGLRQAGTEEEDAGDARVGLVWCTGSVFVITAKPEPGGSDGIGAENFLHLGVGERLDRLRGKKGRVGAGDNVSQPTLFAQGSLDLSAQSS